MEKVFETKSSKSNQVNDVVGDDPVLKAGVDSLNRSEAKTARRKIIDPDEKKGEKSHRKEKMKTYDLETVSKFIEDTVYNLNGVTKDDDIFKESSLSLDEESLYFDIHTDIFRKRFLTFFLMNIYDDLEIIVDTMYMEVYHKKPETPKEKESKNYKLIEKMVCKEIYSNVEKLEKDMLSGNANIYKWLIKLTSMDFCYPFKKEKNSFEDKYITNLEKCIPHMREICKTDIFNKREKYDDYIVFHLLRTAFCYTIESVKYDTVIQHSNLKDCKLDCNFDKAVIMLGHGIKRQVDKNEYMKVTPIFNAFVDAHPLIATTIPSCNKLEQSNTAIKSIYLVKFLCADKNVDKVIDEILR